MKLASALVSLLGLSTPSVLTDFVDLAVQQPILKEQVAASAPSVIINNGTITGSTANNIDSFLGIPFAKPPVGNLRLRLPQSIDASYGTFNATSVPRACPQQFQFNLSSTVPGFQAAVANNAILQTLVAEFGAGINTNFSGEDCLTLNVQRVGGTKSSSKLPVLFWMYGGGWEIGSTQFYDATQILQKSTSLGHEFIFVAANYRLGAFGFLPGRELQAEGNTNLGLHDQRLAMKWVQENIEAFGGDPTKVTIWGESAGSVSTFIHILANNGNPNGLFRAAIMESGTAYNTLPVDSDQAQNLFNQIVEYCNCSSAADKPACLRSVPYPTLEAASAAQPNFFGYQSLAIVFSPRPDPRSTLYPRSPYDSLRRGIFARVPIIAGDQEDEGTVFAIARGQDTLSTTDQIISYFTTWWPTAARSTVAKFINTYSPDPAAGSPFRTGTNNQLYSGYKRVAAIVGDWTFILARRIALHYINTTKNAPPLYSYLQTFFHGLPALGTLHVSDVFVEFQQAGFPQVQDAVLTYYTSFIHYLDPNRLVDRLNATYGRTQWPKWTDEKPVLLELGRDRSAVIPDDFREESYKVFLESAEELRVG